MILVTGDVVLDHNVYEGGRLTPDAGPGNGSHYLPIPGGARLAHDLLKELEGSQVRFGLAALGPSDYPHHMCSRGVWRSVGDIKPGEGRHWALDRHLGFGEKEDKAYPATGVDENPPRVLVIDDGGLGFRDTEAAWPGYLKQEKPPEKLDWIVLKTSRPLVGGLWGRLTQPFWRERLIVIVSADHLRGEGLLVAGGLSWETAVDGIAGEVESNGAFRQLRHFIVTMRSDAALWLDQPGTATSSRLLVFDRKRCEGEWEADHKDCKAYGFLSAFVACVAWSLLDAPRSASGDVDLAAAMATGLSTGRFLARQGHGKAPGTPAFPFASAAQHMRETRAEQLKTKAALEEGKAEFGKAAADVQTYWSILGQLSPWHTRNRKVSYEPARRLALFGPAKLPTVPCAAFGKLETVDRHEIDSLRSLRQSMLVYRDGVKRDQPLCLAVFGAPGSGKSFGLEQIAKGVFGENTSILKFNLSQFNGPGDLIGAFHQVRDKVLSGATPVAFWDEFDSDNFKWLQYFLAPMQDGAFQEGQVTHFLGKSVFVFAGGTSSRFEQFRCNSSNEDFKLKKGPDFISRIAGYLDIAGPNPREFAWDRPPDMEFPVRRATVIRTALELQNRPLEIEDGLLTALLGTSRYLNGARSLNKLVTYIRDSGVDGMLRRAYLPPDRILALYIEDVPQFHRLTRTHAGFHAQAELLARAIHEDYLSKAGQSSGAPKPYNKPWNQLPKEIQESNISAALRIPLILDLAGLTLVAGVQTSQEALEILNANLELMAAAEHGGWEEEKRMGGWRYSAARDDATRRHPLLLPFGDLTPEVKDYDRSMIRNYPKYAELAGFGISVASPKATVGQGWPLEC